jgi:hypothetical protein
VKLAHVASTIMILLVSVATMITLGQSTFQAVIASIQSGHPNYIMCVALCVLLGMVFSMDVAALYSSTMIRILWSRHTKPSAMLVHEIVIAFVMVLEGLTYWLMVLQYEHPTTNITYVVGVARCFGAPAIAIYLSLAMLASVTKADMLGVASMQSGIVAIGKLSTATGDPNTSLGQVWRVFDAAESGDIGKLILVVDGNSPEPMKLLPAPQAVELSDPDNGGGRTMLLSTGVTPNSQRSSAPTKMGQKPPKTPGPSARTVAARTAIPAVSDVVLQKVQLLMADGKKRSPVVLARDAGCSMTEALAASGLIHASQTTTTKPVVALA